MKNHLYVLDLDRTLFNTDRFANDLIALLSKQFGIDAAAYRQEMGQYFDPVTEAYDFYRHATTATGASPGELNTAIQAGLPSQSYVYEDVAPWLAHHQQAGMEIVVMTTGHRSFQQLKLDYSPELAKLPHIITPHNKGAVLKQYLANTQSASELPLTQYNRVILVDDNPITFEGLGRTSRIAAYQLARLTERYSQTAVPAGVQRIISLKELS
jgi:FMN phosphatase YigB (HAD superfamily)